MAQQYIDQLNKTLESFLIQYQVRVYRDPGRIRADCFEVFRTTPSLQPRIGALPRNPNQLIFLAGTVPIVYNGAQYNIPIAIWLTEQYPFSPPLCFVTPTPGVCYLPYLSSWNHMNCNLAGVIAHLSKVFAQDPPVRSAPTQQTPINIQNLPPSPMIPHSPIPTQPSVPQQAMRPPMPGTQFENPADVAKRNALARATEKTQYELRKFNEKTSAEIDQQMAKTSEKEQALQRLDLELDRIRVESDSVQHEITELEDRYQQISTWLDQNHNVMGEVDIDAITDPKDPLTKQLLNLVAEDATIEDTLYYLEKALGRAEIETDVFLKTVRNLSTDQFMVRATIKKVHERQRGGK